MTTSIRIASAADAPSLAAIYAPIVRETVISFESVPPDAAEMARRVESVLPTHPWLVLERGGSAAGYAYAARHRDRDAYRWSVDVSVYVAADARRAGAGSALYRALFAILELQGFARAFAGITLPNPASVALHESLGFSPVGVYERVGFKAGAWRDVGWWHRDLARFPSTPPEPTPFGAIAATPAVAALFRSA